MMAKQDDILEKQKVGELELTYTSYQGGVERWYFWLLDFIKGLGYDTKKIEENEGTIT